MSETTTLARFFEPSRRATQARAEKSYAGNSDARASQARAGEAGTHARTSQARANKAGASQARASDADIFLKRSAAYYHAQPPSSLESAHATARQRDPMLAATLQSLAPSDTHFSPASMHTRLQSAQQTLTKALALFQNNAPPNNAPPNNAPSNAAPHNAAPHNALGKNLIADAQTLQQRITEALNLQQEAFDNQRLLIKA